MFHAIRARVTAAFAAFITMSIVALAIFSPVQAEAYGSFGGARSFSSARAYSAPRMVMAPRVIVAPRAVVVVSPRPIIIAPRPMFYPRPVIVPIVPFVQPQQVVEADGSAQPEIVQVERHSGLSLLYVVFLVLLILVVIGGGGYYGYSYIGGMTPFDVDAIICADLAYEAFYDGGDFL